MILEIILGCFAVTFGYTSWNLFQKVERLEGWIEEAPWEETINRQRRRIPGFDGSPLENRDNRIQNEELNDVLESSDDFVYRERQLKIHQEDDDPWI